MKILPAFDRTCHQISNIETDVKANKATATADVVANHYLDDLFWQIVDGKIELFREYYDPIVFQNAFGLTNNK